MSHYRPLPSPVIPHFARKVERRPPCWQRMRGLVEGLALVMLAAVLAYGIGLAAHIGFVGMLGWLHQ